MDLILVTYLLSIGFLVGLSGAMIPGPLLAFIISESIKKGKFTGFIVTLKKKRRISLRRKRRRKTLLNI